MSMSKPCWEKASFLLAASPKYRTMLILRFNLITSLGLLFVLNIPELEKDGLFTDLLYSALKPLYLSYLKQFILLSISERTICCFQDPLVWNKDHMYKTELLSWLPSSILPTSLVPTIKMVCISQSPCTIIWCLWAFFKKYSLFWF